MTPTSKLYIVVLSTLSAGMKAAQACHALRAFGASYPDIDRDWYETSNNIVVLEHDDPAGLADRLDAHGMMLARFNEPDMDGALTSICVAPEARKLLSRVPLACSIAA